MDGKPVSSCQYFDKSGPPSPLTHTEPHSWCVSSAARNDTDPYGSWQGRSCLAKLLSRTVPPRHLLRRSETYSLCVSSAAMHCSNSQRGLAWPILSCQFIDENGSTSPLRHTDSFSLCVSSSAFKYIDLQGRSAGPMLSCKYTDQIGLLSPLRHTNLYSLCASFAA